MKGLQNLSKQGRNLLRHESNQFYRKKDDANAMKRRRQELEREIYRLENELNTHQKKREKLELKNKNLKNIKAQKDKEIDLIKQEISVKDKDISDSEKILKNLQNNIEEITLTAINY